MIILGIDPGTNRIGYGAISQNREIKLLDYGTIEVKDKNDILTIIKKFTKLLKDFKPELIAVEKLFFSKNKKTALAVAQTRGILISKIIENKIPFEEYGPIEVKQSVSGYGLSDKKSVAKMVKYILKTEDLNGYDDATDALAIAITAANNLSLTNKIKNI